MKKIFYFILAIAGVSVLSSCSDMLDVESSREVNSPELNEKTDSVFFAYGVLQAMQQLGDQYFFQNELRGDLATTTSNATVHLKNLSDFSAGAENKYDSVYQYYKVINNCNYYLANRDTTLATGQTNVVINEFVAMASIRAWAYLQLTNQYGDVPYITEPVLSISEINAAKEKSPYLSILSSQADYLQKLKDTYSDNQLKVPFFRSSVPMGQMNFSKAISKTYAPSKCFIPINIVLGELYLQLGEYRKAAVCFFDYLRIAASGDVTKIKNNYSNRLTSYDTEFQWPSSYNDLNGNKDLQNGIRVWDEIFYNNGTPGDEVISYIPFAVNYTYGKTTEIPAAFGYDYYRTSEENAETARTLSNHSLYGCPEKETVDVIPSDEYLTMSKTAPYYIYTNEKDPNSVDTRYLIGSENIGDARANFVVRAKDVTSNAYYVQKPSTGFVYLYRNSTVYLRLAEALNRMREPELAFAVLKTGIHSDIKDYVDTAYVSTGKIPQEKYFIPYNSYKLLKSGELGFFSDENLKSFTNDKAEIAGIHFHGAGAVNDRNFLSTYSYKDVVEARINKIRAQYSVGSGAFTKDEYINAVEDLLCDEYALEFAFEGCRFSDLLRIARHKNLASPYGAAFGDRWLSDKLAAKKAGITTQNCYLPFK